MPFLSSHISGEPLKMVYYEKKLSHGRKKEEERCITYEGRF